MIRSIHGFYDHFLNLMDLYIDILLALSLFRRSAPNHQGSNYSSTSLFYPPQGIPRRVLFPPSHTSLSLPPCAFLPSGPLALWICELCSDNHADVVSSFLPSFYRLALVGRNRLEMDPRLEFFVCQNLLRAKGTDFHMVAYSAYSSVPVRNLPTNLPTNYQASFWFWLT